MSAPVMIMAGGTGGHVFPALAVAEELRRREVPVVWLGTRRGLESRLVPAAGFPVEWINVGGLRGRGPRRWLGAPLNLLRAAWQSWRAMRRHAPRSVLGMGGFVAGPGGLVAWLTGRPLLIHEQNAVPGLTNRLLAGRADRVMQAFPGAFADSLHALVTGNPVRAGLFRDHAAGPRAVRRPPHLLVVGGSQGARALNQALPAAIAGLAEPPRVRHQCGQAAVEALRQAYSAVGIEARVEAFIADMAEAYAWADLAVTRAGAMTISELASAGLGAILVPFPHAVDDHQTRNAACLVEAGAAVLVPESELTAEHLAGRLRELLGDPERLRHMAERAGSLARPDAARLVADQCLEVAR